MFQQWFRSFRGETRSVWGIVLLVILLGVWGALLAIRITTPTRPYEIDPDEGLNAIKALLFLHGHTLHGDVWSDQPPGFTVALAGWMKLVHMDAEFSRLIVPLYSVLLAVSLWSLVRASTSASFGLLATLLLLTSNRFARWSSALMIGLPALTLGTAAVACVAQACRSAKRRRTWLLVAGFLLSAGVFTKLFAALLVVPLVLILFLQENRSLRERITDITVVGISSVVSLLALTAIFAPTIFTTGWPQLLLPHLAARDHPHTGQNMSVLAPILRSDRLMLYLAVSSLLALLRNWRTTLPPLAWAALGFWWMYNHQPLWPHHYVLLAIPLAWLAGLGAHALVMIAVRESKFVLCAVMLLALLIVVVRIGSQSLNRLQRVSKPQFNQLNVHVIANVKKFSRPGEYLLTDRPIYAFYAGVPVVPRYAVVSAKRRRAGRLRPDAFARYLATSRPAVFLLARFKDFVGPARDILDQHYVQVYRSVHESVYVRRDRAEELQGTVRPPPESLS